jgi:S-adenosylmethionine decarboxylase
MDKDPVSPAGLTEGCVPPGMHLLLDFWGARYMSNLPEVEKALRAAAAACDARVLEVRLHGFGDNAGVTGVAVLAESHITIHTWPEIGYAALDVFVCGACDAAKAAEELIKFFQPRQHRVTAHHRGAMPPERLRAIGG